METILDGEVVGRPAQKVAKSRRYFLGDPSFKEFSGHCLEYLQSIARPLSERNYSVQLIGNRELIPSLASDLSAACAFTYWCDERVPPNINHDLPEGRQKMKLEHERAMKEDLKQLDDQFSFTANDVLVINTLRHWQLRGVVDWVESVGRSRAPHVVLILHFTAFPVLGVDRGDSEIYREAFSRIENSDLRSRFVLMADSEELIHEYRASSNLDFKLAPIPHCARSSDTNKDVNTKLKLAYVGEARHNKGFHLMPWVVKGFMKGPYRDDVHFAIQSFCSDPRNPAYRMAMAKMSGCSNITLYPDQLDEEQYHAFLEGADVILVPYLLDNYYVQTSGIYGEAIGMGKPVVVPRGSWMATQVHKFGGGVVFAPGDPQAFLDACTEVVRDFPKYRADARAGSVAWGSFHTPERLVEMIEAAVGPARS